MGFARGVSARRTSGYSKRRVYLGVCWGEGGSEHGQAVNGFFCVTEMAMSEDQLKPEAIQAAMKRMEHILHNYYI